MSLTGRSVVVTGATRGIGHNIVLGFEELGANVYITGRTEKSLVEVAQMVRNAGGNCEYFIIDHSSDADVAKLFRKIQARLSANDSKLGVFVNNTFVAVPFVVDSMKSLLWKKDADNPAKPNVEAEPGKVWDLVNGVGLKNNYVCAVRTMRIMEPRGTGLIVNITSFAGTITFFDVAYSVGKEAVDRMSAEIALAAPRGVQCIAFCPCYVPTESFKLAPEDGCT